MKLGFKKIFAALTAAAVSVSMCGCMDNGKIMTVDGMEINNGVYLYYQQSAYSDAQKKIDEAQEASSESTSDSSGPYFRLIELSCSLRLLRYSKRSSSRSILPNK